MKSLSKMQAEVYTNNVDHGWFDAERGVGDDIALLHTEVSEAYEAYRQHGTEPYTDVKGKPDDFGSELADVLIRLLDTCQRTGIDLEAEYERKMTFNRSRTYRHGGKRV